MSAARVESVSTTVVDLPLRRRHRFSVTEIDQQSLVLVRVRTADGAEGFGEAVAPGGPWWGGESVETMRAIIDGYLAPLVVGRDVADVQAVRAQMDRQVNENRFAKAGLETALYDAWGRTLGVPVHALLGGLVRDSLPVTWALGASDADDIIGEATAKLEAGEHHSFKLKMGSQDPAADIGRIEKVAAALASRASLRVDLNASWDELTATRYLPRLQEAGIELVEQPLPAWDTDGMARLAGRLDMPVMADESVRSEHDAFRLARIRAADIFSLKVTKSGGFTVTARIAAVAAAAGIPCHGGTSIESSIGTVAALHSYCTLPAVTFGSELFGPLLTADDLLTEPLTYRDGHLHVPEGPGLGVSVDEDSVRHFSRKE
ncbi:MAG: chloromuconate cycloisomerase [Streptosporangiales bacterium]|nr:chloromuconate cycloisomerase [Streptosporangiales bacterium]